MAQCAGSKRDGGQCTVTVSSQQSYCWWHDPAHAHKRRQTASRGGKAKASKPTKGLHELLGNLIQRVIDGELETSRGAVANQLIGTRIRLLEYERRVNLEELEERLGTLERAAEVQGRGGGKRWGA